ARAEEGVKGEIVVVVAGKPAVVPAPEDLVARVQERIAAGERMKEAVAEVAKETGARRRSLYEAVLESRERDIRGGGWWIRRGRGTLDDMSTNRALIVVDVQPTFCEGGALGVEGGNAVAERIAEFVGSHRGDYDLVVTTQDWHIDPGDHFSDTPDFVDSWPPHGVAGTPEAELHPALAGLDADHGIKKGQYEAAYSGFEGKDEDGNDLA